MYRSEATDRRRGRKICRNDKMELSYRPYTLALRNVFTLANSSRTITPVVLTEIKYDGITGYGEASLPPYLEETPESVVRFLSGLDLSDFTPKVLLSEILAYTDRSAPGNAAAKAAVDIALHDLYGKYMQQAWWRKWGLDRRNIPCTSFTIGIASPDEVRRKVSEAADFRILKVKLGRNTDKEIIETLRSVTDCPVCVDVNQGWTDKYQALDMIGWCREHGVVFVEQPMPRDRLDDTAWLTARSPLPVIADESFRGMEDFDRVAGAFTGINIKLMKCGGMATAYRMIAKARSLGMKVMLGCMTETSCAISAAAQLSPLVDWTDLDGNLLIANDCFCGARLSDGKVIPADEPGIGVRKKETEKENG